MRRSSTTTRGVGAAERRAALCAPERRGSGDWRCTARSGRVARRWAAVAAARAAAVASRSAIAAFRAADACSTARRSARASTKPTKPERRLMMHRRHPRPTRSARPPHECGSPEPRGARTRGVRRAADAATPAPGDRPRAAGGSPRQHARGERRARARRAPRGSTAHARALGTPGTATRLHATWRRGRGAARRSRRDRRRASTQPILADARAAHASATETGNVDRHVVSGARHRERARENRHRRDASVHDRSGRRRSVVHVLPKRLRLRRRRRGTQPFLDPAHRDARHPTNHDFLQAPAGDPRRVWRTRHEIPTRDAAAKCRRYDMMRRSPPGPRSPVRPYKGAGPQDRTGPRGPGPA